jgi:hypothetical protein
MLYVDGDAELLRGLHLVCFRGYRFIDRWFSSKKPKKAAMRKAEMFSAAPRVYLDLQGMAIRDESRDRKSVNSEKY